MDRESPLIQKLLPFTEYKDSIVRRGGVVGTLRNCCFDHENHMWLLNEDIDLLPHLLLPLAGPEEFDDEDNEKLPLDLQYLAETKERESDLDIRCSIVFFYNVEKFFLLVFYCSFCMILFQNYDFGSTVSAVCNKGSS